MRQQQRRQHFLRVGINYDNVVKYHAVVTKLTHALRLSAGDGVAAPSSGTLQEADIVVRTEALLGHLRGTLGRAMRGMSRTPQGFGREPREALPQLLQQQQGQQQQLQQGIAASENAGDNIQLVCAKQQLARAMALPAANKRENCETRRSAIMTTLAGREEGSSCNNGGLDLLFALRQQAAGRMRHALIFLWIRIRPLI